MPAYPFTSDHPETIWDGEVIGYYTDENQYVHHPDSKRPNFYLVPNRGCIFCEAKPGEVCRSATGKPTPPHSGRVR